MYNIIKNTTPKGVIDQYMETDTLNGYKLPQITRNMVHKLGKHDKKIYKKLPQKLIIYRGCHKDEVNNPTCQSWTLSLDVARHFAWVHYAANNKFTYDEMKDRVVLKATIAKKDIYAYLGEVKKEDECIVNLNGLKDIEIIEEYDYDNIEKIYYNHLIKKMSRQYKYGIRGKVNLKMFKGNILRIDIEDFLFPYRNESI